jgi:TonB-linked SusC/RagA family outer membrane protein
MDDPMVPNARRRTAAPNKKERGDDSMTLKRLARWSYALALTASLSWAQEPTSDAASTSGAPATEATTSTTPTEAAPAPETPAAGTPAQPAPEPEARVLTGRVIDTKTKDPLPVARVSVKGTSLAVETDLEGKFTLTGVPRESFVLNVQEQDHMRRDITVTPDVRSITVELTESYVEELVVVGRATEVARKNLANAVATVKAEDVAKAPAQTMDAALQGKVAGANIQANSGAPGGGMQLRLRGVSTIIGQTAPLFVVDGVIVSDIAIANGMSAVTRSTSGSNASSTQDGQVNRIADLNTSDVENIEILKGASAAAIYGSKASNGVVIITTKKGRTGGEPRVELAQRFGTYQLSHQLGARRFTSAAEAQAAFGAAAAQHYVDGVVYDHEKQLAGRSDLSTETFASLSGSAGNTTYYASALVKGDKGIIINTGYDKQALRLNLGHRFSEDLEVQLSSNLIHTLSRRGLTNNDNNNVSHYMVLSSTPSFINLNQNVDGTWPRNPFIGGAGTNPLQTALLATNDEDVWRLLASGDALWKIWGDKDQQLKLAANFGVDRFQQKNELLFPPELNFEPVDDGLAGTSLFGTHENLNLNWGVNLVHTYRPSSGGILDGATTSIGLQQESRDLTSTYLVSRNLVAGQANVDSGTQVAVTQRRQRVLDRGFYIQEEVLGLSERLQLVGALRAEGSSANGDPNALYLFPKAAASYRVPGLPTWFEELKVRAAYGQTGNLPLYGMKFTPLRATFNIEGNAGIVVGGVAGDPEIGPERQSEVELGIDALMFDGTTVVELTGYQRTIDDLLLQRTLAPSTGFTTQIFNGGQLQNTGVEAMVQVTPFQSQDGFSWVSRTTFAVNRSQITKLPVPAFNTGGFGVSLGAFRIEEGRSATQIVGNDGIDPDTGQTIVRAIGDTEPDFRVSFLNDFRYGQFSLATNFEWQQGSDVINLTRFLYDLAQNSPDYECPTDPANCMGAGEKRLDDWTTKKLTRAYLEDASFLKLRELTLSYELPASMFEGAFKVVRRAKVSISGRNLLTFTNYSGLDPEVSNFGNQAIARNIDVAPFPPSRSYWGSIELGF